jgi:hypothetical protein
MAAAAPTIRVALVRLAIRTARGFFKNRRAREATT